MPVSIVMYDGKRSHPIRNLSRTAMCPLSDEPNHCWKLCHWESNGTISKQNRFLFFLTQSEK